ncbi:MAG TPA: GTP 3',8-cyclase MoaA [Spirochaetia bacterium]|nr:GTP 3',8-cyclase MoaA [Spirochaetia bacterium]
MSDINQGQPVRDLFGRPLHDLRISVIDSCNFRCPYCMPAEVFGDAYRFLKSDELLTFEEITRIAGLFARLGVVKLKLTGGEPLLRPWLPELVNGLAAIDGIEDLALITNGAHLERMARQLRAAGLRRLTVSLDSLDEQTFALMNGKAHRLQPVLNGIAAAEAAGFQSIKLNAVVIRGMNDHQVLDLVRRFRGTAHIVRFIEFMDAGNRNGWRRELVVPSRETLAAIDAEFPLEPVEPSYRGEVASRYRFADGQGEIGFISSVSQPFCRDCTRARLSADGRLYTCLFAAKGFDLRDLLRRGATDDELLAAIRTVWSRRADHYSEERGGAVAGGLQKVEMYTVGG